MSLIKLKLAGAVSSFYKLFYAQKKSAYICKYIVLRLNLFMTNTAPSNTFTSAATLTDTK